jgi:hypothetical protein
MSKLTEQKDWLPIKAAFLHTAICWPGTAGAETTISDAKIKGIKMNIIPQGLLLECKGKKCLVPHTNVVNYVLE